MRRRMMKSKIHRATVTDANLHYVGSITLDTDLMARADILEHEQVPVLDIDNGARFETYAIQGGPGEVCLNGAAARLVQPGDKVIVITYADYERRRARGLRARRRPRRRRPTGPVTLRRGRAPVGLTPIPSRPRDPVSWSSPRAGDAPRSRPGARRSICWSWAAAWPGCRPRCAPRAPTACGSAC